LGHILLEKQKKNMLDKINIKICYIEGGDFFLQDFHIQSLINIALGKGIFYQLDIKTQPIPKQKDETEL
jgi:hypothetical protein